MIGDDSDGSIVLNDSGPFKLWKRGWEGTEKETEGMESPMSIRYSPAPNPFHRLKTKDRR